MYNNKPGQSQPKQKEQQPRDKMNQRPTDRTGRSQQDTRRMSPEEHRDGNSPRR